MTSRPGARWPTACVLSHILVGPTRGRGSTSALPTNVVSPHTKERRFAMTTIEDGTAEAAAPPATGRCPVDHAAYGRRKAVAPDSAGPDAPPVARDAAGVWHVRGFEEARAVLRSSATRQAGFGVEQITRLRGLANQPILFQDGKVHQEQRATTARFFTPRTVSASYRTLMERQAARLVGRLRRTGQADLSRLSLTMAMQVAAQVVGLIDSPLRGLARRLDSFLEHPARPGSRLGATARQVRSLWRMGLFYWFDVRPAIRARRAAPREDVISHLVAQGYSPAEILIECVTYGAAGMATTR